MASALQQQLAAIAANSTHQLDLKTQKARHGKSLLFEPREAATQSFEIIFQICSEGFEELCVLDSRFAPFSNNLFGAQSKDVDRTELTAKENTDLNRVVDAFLGLVCGRLLLKPAIKAMEWLVRRFRVQEYNTEAVLMAFLPYHTAQVFPTLLSILPTQLPSNFRFLSPYIASLQSPPRHAILSAMINNSSLLNGFSQFVFKVARTRHQSAVLLGFWASITAQAINGLIDSTRSGREAIRQQREEDVLLRNLPILQTALSIRDVPETYLGSCMIITIIASKIALEEKVLDALMEAVAGAWTEQTIEDGIMCLAVLAEEKKTLSQPIGVTRALGRRNNIVQLLAELSSRLRATKLLIATCLAATTRNTTQLEPVTYVKQLLDTDLLSEDAVSTMIVGLLDEAANAERMSTLQANRQLFVNVFNTLSTHARSGRTLRDAVSEHNDKYLALIATLGIVLTGGSELGDYQVESVLDDDEDMNATPETPLVEMNSLPELPPARPSFLDPANDEIYSQYITVFEDAAASDQTIKQFTKLPALISTGWENNIALLTFLARAWTEQPSATLRSRALRLAAAEMSLRKDHSQPDLQVLYPYLITGLEDSSALVRRHAAKLCSLVGLKTIGSSKPVSGDTPWASTVLYGSENMQLAHQRAGHDLNAFFRTCVMPTLGDSILDGDRITHYLAEVLKGSSSQHHSPDSMDFSSATRAAVVETIARHAVASPVLNVKLCLLKIISGCGKTADATRKDILVPFVEGWAVRSESNVEAMCDRQQVGKDVLDKAVLDCLTSRSEEELDLLKGLASGSRGSRPHLSAIALQCLRSLWRTLKTPGQILLIDFLMGLAVDGPAKESNDLAQGEALEVIRNIKYDTEVLLHLVETSPSIMTGQESKPSTKRRRTSKSEYVEQRPSDPLRLNKLIRKITLVLEIIEGSEPSKHPQLLKGLFNMLAELNTYKALLGSQLLYLQSLLMSCLLSVVDGVKAAAKPDVDRSVIRADLIVECVRTTSSTQIHNTALLLISSLAGWAPELVLHNVMPLFTFMSTTLLRQSDEYSAHVTDQTVACIVPPLAASLRKRGKDLASGASELLLSFTTAYEHVPLHRRDGLFHNLVATLGAEDSLYAVLAMLVEKYPNDSQLTTFAIDLNHKFPVTTQLKAYTQYLGLVFDAMKPKRGISDLILGLAEQNSEQIAESIENLLQKLAELLQSQGLRKRLARELGNAGNDVQAIQTVYAELLDHVMRLSRQTASNEDLKPVVDAVLASLLALLPTKDFIESSAKLMQTGSDETRQQVFRSLEARVAEARRGDSSLQQVYLEVLPNCCAFIRKDQPVATRHSAITCIDQIVEKYGKKDRTAVLAAAEQVAGDDALCSTDSSLRVISILCLASMIDVLGDEFIGILPKVLNKGFDYLEETLGAQYIDQNIHSAVFGLASAVLDHLPWLFSAQQIDRIIQLGARSASRGTVADSTQFFALAAQKVSADETSSAIQRTWTHVLERGVLAIEQHLRFLQQTVKHHTKPIIAHNAPVLFAILLQAFDLRLILTKDQELSVRDAECFALVDQIALDMTLKLNDSTFRPFFIRLAEWANAAPKSSPHAKIMRKTALYSFTNLLFGQLKSIVTSYSSFILDDAAQLLDTLRVTVGNQRQLFDLVLQVLAISFQNDQDDFWQSPNHIDTIMPPVIRQLEKASTVPVADHIVPAIVELAEATASPDHQKAMNALIMNLMRHGDAAVRLAAIQCERAVTARLNFDWLALLPEMLPYISEAQEDDDEDVERETLRWVKQIEDITGESLDSMLQ